LCPELLQDVHLRHPNPDILDFKNLLEDLGVSSRYAASIFYPHRMTSAAMAKTHPARKSQATASSSQL
jgi:hypothetical protein